MIRLLPSFASSLRRCFGGTRFTGLLIVIALMPIHAQQSNPSVMGDYVGVLGGSLHLRLHLKADAKGALSGTLDSLNQGAMGLECADFHMEGDALSFSVPVVHGSWKGTVSADAKTLTGTWDQGSPMPLVFTRDTFVPALSPRAWMASGWGR